jgi:hypothetical protein
MTILNSDNARLKFGAEGFKNPTPKLAKNIFRLISSVVGVWAIIQHFHLGLQPETIAIINEWAIGAVPITHVFTKSFGWDYSNKD